MFRHPPVKVIGNTGIKHRILPAITKQSDARRAPDCMTAGVRPVGPDLIWLPEWLRNPMLLLSKSRPAALWDWAGLYLST
jgi:hypothetical protein